MLGNSKRESGIGPTWDLWNCRNVEQDSLTSSIAKKSKVRIHKQQISSQPSRQRSDVTSCQNAQNHFHFVPAHHHNVPVSGTYYGPFVFPFPTCATMTFPKRTKTAVGYRRPVIFSRHCSHSSLSVF